MDKLGKIGDAAFSDIFKKQFSSFQKNVKAVFKSFTAKTFPSLKYTLEIGDPYWTWTECLSKGFSYVAPLNLIRDNSKKRLHIWNIPLLTPRGTFIIDGQERIVKKILIATDMDKKDKTELSQAEKTRDLRYHNLVVIDFYKILSSWIQKSLEKDRDFYKIALGRWVKDDNEGLSSISEYTKGFESLVCGIDFYSKIFNSETGINYFPFLDSTNPLSEVEDMRKLIFPRGERTMFGRDIHPSHYGRLCVVETPESEKIGMRLHLAHQAKIENGKILTPRESIKDESIKYVSPENDAPTADGLTELTENGKVLVRDINSDGNYIDASKVQYRDASVDQLFGYGALQVPFIQHNDPARALMGAKNLKQAVPLKDPEVPIVKTGYEKTVAELSGRIIRAEEEGLVKDISNGAVIISSNNREKRYPFVQGVPSVISKTAFIQKPVVKKGESVKSNQIIIESTGIKDGELALGANFLVAYMPYYGFNIDDGIVVSEDAAKKLISTHIEEFEVKIQERDILIQETLIKRGTFLRVQGSLPELAVIKRKKKGNEYEDVSIIAKEDMLGGTVERISADSEKGKITIWIKKEKHLEVGDKLMGRHGNKGVVSRILSSEKMPYFEVEINGKKEVRHIEIMLNPHSVISRMNLGQIYETHFGWIAKMHPNENTRQEAKMMGKPFARIDLGNLSKWLKESGLDEHGKIKVKFPDGQETENPVVVGYQYIVKLNHLASSKLSIRGETGPVSYITDMPLAGKKRYGGQRIGEMEVWALIAHGANEILSDMLGVKANANILIDNAISISESLKVLIYLLRGLGIAFEVFDSKDQQIQPEDFSNRKRNEIKHYKLRFANDNDIMRWGYHWDEQGRRWDGPKNITKLSELISDHKEETGYINLAESVTLCGRSLKTLPVIPIRCRPRLESNLNRLYKRIFLLNNKLDKLKKENKSTTTYSDRLNDTVKKLEKEISKLIKGKGGIIRKAILGKRVNLSARAVIVPDPTIPSDSALIPRKIMSELKIKDPEIVKTEDGDQIEKAQKVLLNRQPTLHIHNIQAFNAIPHGCNAIAINPLIRKGFNADFDGDTMSLYVTDKTIPDGMNVSGNIFLAANGKLSLDFSQDISAGIYYASITEKGKEKIEKIINDKEIFDASKNNTPLTNKDISDIVYKYYLKHKDRNITLHFAEKIAKFGFEQATLSGLTFGIFDIQKIHLSSDEKKASNYNVTDIENSLTQKLEDNPTNPISVMILSGAKGDIKQLRQMAGLKGIVERLGGKSTSASINSSYLEGLKPTEYYLACFGARKSLGDKKLMTPKCGYLTRRLAFSSLDMKIDKEDCKTEEGVSLEIDLSLGRTLLKDVSINGDTILKNNVIDEDFLDRLKKAGINKIDVRSPLKCGSGERNICKRCYGWDLSKKREPDTGFAVGIMSAEVIGERATQDAMRTYHKGEATATIKDFNDIECIFDNAKNPGTHTRVSVNIKSKDDAFQLAKELFEIYEKKVDIKHYEVIIRALMSGDEYKGTRKVIADKGVLYKASYERAVDEFRECAKEIKTISLSNALEKLFK